MARLNSLSAAVGNLQPGLNQSRGDYELALGCVWNRFAGDRDFRYCDDKLAELHIFGSASVLRPSRFVRLSIPEPEPSKGSI
jgi:hypothetical protein